MNKYDLQIKNNFYKTPEQFQGNGVYKDFVEGCFEDGKDFLLYPFRGVFYLWVGYGEELKIIATIRVKGVNDMNSYHIKEETFFKYADPLLDWYKSNCINKDCIETRLDIDEVI